MAEQFITYDGKRITEWAAVFYMITRYFPSIIFSRLYASPPDVYRKTTQRLYNSRLYGGDGLSFSEDIPTWMLMETKECGNCGGVWPATEEYWHRNPNGKRGLHSLCIYCRCTDEQRRYRRKKDRG